MRIKVTFENPYCVLPMDQNYILGCAVYNTLSNNKEYADFLHGTGYVHEASNRRFKLYTYSSLMGDNREILSPNALVYGSETLTWQISSPMPDFINIFSNGLLKKGELNINAVPLKLKNIATIREPDYKNKMNYSCLAPIVISTSNDGRNTEYLGYDDKRINKLLYQNLIKKYELINKKEYTSGTTFSIEFDKNYIENHPKSHTKLCVINNISVKGIFAPFILNCDIELQKTALSCGLGGKNSMGFGMVKAVN